MARLEHIGIAVADAPAVATLYEQVLGAAPYKAETVEREGVRTHFVSAGTAKLELLEALGPDSPVAKYLDKRGEGLHHLAFEVTDLPAHIERLKALGYRPLADAPRPGADGKQIVFLHPKETHGVLVELCESVPTPFPATEVPFRDGTLAVYERGRAANPTVLVVHGAAGSTNPEQEALIRRLETTLHVLAVNLPGHGASSAYADTPLSFDLFTEALLAVLDHFDLGRAHAFGYSMGGYAALHLARHHAARVGRLALHETGFFWDDETAASLSGFFEQAADASEKRTAPFVAMHGADRWPGLARRTADLIGTLPEGPLREDDLRQIEAPTLVTAGDRAQVFSLAQTLRLREALPEGALALLPETGHRMHHLDLDAYAPVLQRWFSA